MDSAKYARSKFEHQRHFDNVPDPGRSRVNKATNPGSGSATKNLSIFTGSRIRTSFFHPGSRGRKGTGSRIRIRNTAFRKKSPEQKVCVFERWGEGGGGEGQKDQRVNEVPGGQGCMYYGSYTERLFGLVCPAFSHYKTVPT
jgi:hypothetical protein